MSPILFKLVPILLKAGKVAFVLLPHALAARQAWKASHSPKTLIKKDLS